MQCLAKLTYQEKVDILCKVIRRKSRYGISDHSLGIILDNLNLHRPHIVKVTTDHIKFLNIATVEMVALSDGARLSYVTKIYGDFQCGYFFKSPQETNSMAGSMDFSKDAAFLKRTIFHLSGQSPIVTYTLVLFESGKPNSSIHTYS